VFGRATIRLGIGPHSSYYRPNLITLGQGSVLLLRSKLHRGVKVVRFLCFYFRPNLRQFNSFDEPIMLAVIMKCESVMRLCMSVADSLIIATWADVTAADTLSHPPFIASHHILHRSA